MNEQLFDPYASKFVEVDRSDVLELLDEEPVDVSPWSWDELSARYDGWLPEYAAKIWRALIGFSKDVSEREIWPPDEPYFAEEFLELQEPLYDLLSRSPRTPRVFISYRSTDRPLANHLRRQLLSKGKSVWMDCWDPSIATVRASALPPIIESILIATIIEVALLRCSHVIVTHTKNTATSEWVPYELGRAKQHMVIASDAAFWHGDAHMPSYSFLVSRFHRTRDRHRFDQWVASI